MSSERKTISPPTGAPPQSGAFRPETTHASALPFRRAAALLLAAALGPPAYPEGQLRIAEQFGIDFVNQSGGSAVDDALLGGNRLSGVAF